MDEKESREAFWKFIWFCATKMLFPSENNLALFLCNIWLCCFWACCNEKSDYFLGFYVILGKMVQTAIQLYKTDSVVIL